MLKKFDFRITSAPVNNLFLDLPVRVVSRFATTSLFSINVLEFYQITQLSVQLGSIHANRYSFHIEPQLTISCLLIRTNGANNKKMFCMST